VNKEITNGSGMSARLAFGQAKPPHSTETVPLARRLYTIQLASRKVKNLPTYIENCEVKLRIYGVEHRDFPPESIDSSSKKADNKAEVEFFWSHE
jgi:hypothetical protein